MPYSVQNGQNDRNDVPTIEHYLKVVVYGKVIINLINTEYGAFGVERPKINDDTFS